ncbi:MAG: TIGR03943 family protein [Spirochaetaceae bacterium]|nr:TIGR03943 family protein [Spirochaetaceae bacterium]
MRVMVGRRVAAALRAAVVLALAAVLAMRYLDGSLGYFINLRYGWLTVVAMVCLVQLAAALLATAPKRARGETEERVSMPWMGAALLAVPVLLALVPPRPLGTDAMATRALQIGSVPAAAGLGTASELNVGASGVPRTVLDWLVLFDQETTGGGDLSRFAGESARVRGFVYRDERFPAGTFMVSRFLLSCCAADAAPIGLAVRWPDAEFLEDDAWVWVSGDFSVESFLGERMPVLVGAEVTAADQPPQPYLYY